MKVFGIIGGIGSGKSTAAAVFRRFGVPVIDADAAGHRILLLQEVKEAVRQRWGNHVFDSGGDVDRKKLAAVLFADSSAKKTELAFLQSLTHPLIAEEVKRQRTEYEQNGAGICLLDAPLLLECGWDKETDGIIFVDAPEEIRLRRILSRGWTETEWRQRESAQWPVGIKRQRADFILDNSGETESITGQVGTFLRTYSCS
ncbi:MAG: dephospho-CoA kinase [Planctomycetaceae bacterium]|jgi:dephospho-CoA kinase|nr:dephospho-CoA kinase [Planctomycetaceae bacterium]